MVSNRRKGSSKAAAARRKWKISDLVLAKVKGFLECLAYGVDTESAEAAKPRDKILIDSLWGRLGRVVP